MMVIDPVVLLVHSISNRSLSWSDYRIAGHLACPSDIHDHRREPQTVRPGLLVVEDLCDRTVLLRGLIAGYSSRRKAELVVTVAAFAGLVEGVASLQDAEEVCSSRSVP